MEDVFSGGVIELLQYNARTICGWSSGNLNCFPGPRDIHTNSQHWISLFMTEWKGTNNTIGRTSENCWLNVNDIVFHWIEWKYNKITFLLISLHWGVQTFGNRVIPAGVWKFLFDRVRLNREKTHKSMTTAPRKWHSKGQTWGISNSWGESQALRLRLVGWIKAIIWYVLSYPVFGGDPE